MRITKITAYVVKSPAFYDIGGASKVGQTLPGSEYFRFDAYPQLYSRRSEALIVKVDTAEGISGWGETQAPIGPEVAQSVVQHIVGRANAGEARCFSGCCACPRRRASQTRAARAAARRPPRRAGGAHARTRVGDARWLSRGDRR